MNVSVITAKGGAAAREPSWFADVVAAQPKDTIPDMRKVGCTEIRSALNGAGVALIFVWDPAGAGTATERADFVAWWASKVQGMDQASAESALPAGLTSEVPYQPDTYGRPCP